MIAMPLLALAAAAAQAVPAPPPAPFAAAQPGQRHDACLRAVATTLEVSGEGLGDIAAATVAACMPAEERAAEDSAFARLSPKTQNEIVRTRRDDYRGAVHLFLVRLRACRKTVGCDVGTLP